MKLKKRNENRSVNFNQGGRQTALRTPAHCKSRELDADKVSNHRTSRQD